MSPLAKVVIGLAGVGVIGAIVAANFMMKNDDGAAVTHEKVERRDLESFVSASGKTRPRLEVNISANSTGPIKKLAVREGQTVQKGDLLVQIDPKEIQTRIAQAKTAVEEAETRLSIAEKLRDRAQQDLQRLLDVGTSSQKDIDAARSDFEVKEDEAHAASLSLRSAETELERAEHELTKVDIVSPLDGVVTKKHLEEGEMVYGGQMAGGAGTVIMVVSNVSKILVELQVDETDIINVAVEQKVRVEIDAYPDRKFEGVVTEVAESPRAAQADNQAVIFDVVVTLTETDVKVGLSATAEIVTALREKVVAVPIQAVVGREVDGQEVEGVFQNAGGKAKFKKIEIGIQGEKYFEVIDGLGEGEDAITGPYTVLRDLKDDDPVKSD